MMTNVKQVSNRLLIASLLLVTSFGVYAQANWDVIGENPVYRDSITKKGYTLIFVSNAPGFDSAVGVRMVDAFFAVYPKEAKKYNRKTLRKVYFVIDTAYKGVAATAGHTVRYNPDWFKKHPGDIDVVTHEVMHIVQSYPHRAGPGWITEGIADYVRYTMGVDNAGAGWSLPDVTEKHHYDNAYRITARFLVWIEKNGHKGFVKKLDNAMRTKTYQDSFWKDQTGKTVDELWAAYVANPAL